MLLVVGFFRQVHKPSGFVGKRVVRAMNMTHSAMTDWGLQEITSPRDASIWTLAVEAGAPCVNLRLWRRIMIYEAQLLVALPVNCFHSKSTSR